MSSVIRGNSITLEVHFEDGTGILTNATSPRVSIFDPLSVATLVDATPFQTGTGIYQITYLVDSSAPVGTWRAEWQGTVNSQALIGYENFDVYPVGSIAPVPSGSYTYDPSTNVGRVRMYLDDRDMSRVSTAIPLEQRSAIFSDQEIQVFLDMNSSSVLYASAQGLVTISGNRQLLVQSRRIGRTAIDYGEVRKSLQDQAQVLIALANQVPSDGTAEINWNDFAFRQLIINEQLRQDT